MTKEKTNTDNINIMNHDNEFRYRLLSRLQSDCDYYLGYGNRYKKHLWAGDETEQIELMIALHDSFPSNKKPEWLTMDEILEYKRKMTEPQPADNQEAKSLI